MFLFNSIKRISPSLGLFKVKHQWTLGDICLVFDFFAGLVLVLPNPVSSGTAGTTGAVSGTTGDF